jgi:hypothetical protein
MSTPAFLRPMGDSFSVIMSDGLQYTAFPTGGNLWLVKATGGGTGPVDPEEPTDPTDPTDPGAGGELVNWWATGFTLTGNWEAHASYSRGGLDYGMPVGTPLKAVAAGTIVNLPNIDGAGLKTMLVFDKTFARKKPASNTLMNGTYRENPTAPMAAYMYQHLSQQLPERHYTLGETMAISGDTGETTGPHLHSHGLVTASVGGDRLDLSKFV